MFNGIREILELEIKLEVRLEVRLSVRLDVREKSLETLEGNA